MKKKTERKKLLIYLIILSLLLVLNFIPVVYAQDISSKGITTIPYTYDSDLDIFNSIKKIYEISSSSLEKGYYASLNEKDAFKINVEGRNHYFIILNITEKNVTLLFPGERILNFDPDKIILIDVDRDNDLDIQLELKSIEKSYENSNPTANFYIKKFIEKELVPSGDYFELFDLTVRLANELIYSSRDLEAFIIFENFGEGVSEIDIVYSIIDEQGNEVYRGADNKIVQTENFVTKDFTFLKLPIGNYILRTEIFYGENQTGESEQDFEIVDRSAIDILKNPLIFVSIVIVLFITIVYIKRFSKKRKIK